MSNMKLPLRKKLLTEKTERAIKWVCKCSSSSAPPALSNQPAKPSHLRESFLVPGQWRRGEKDTRPHVSHRAEYWGCGIKWGSHPSWAIQKPPKPTLEGPAHHTRLVSLWRSTSANGQLFNQWRSCLSCARSQFTSLFHRAPRLYPT